jgi:hypothetical protein
MDSCPEVELSEFTLVDLPSTGWMKRAADSLSKAPPRSFRNSSRLVGGSRTPCIVTIGMKCESSCLDGTVTYVQGKIMAVEEAVGFFAPQLQNKVSQHSCATLALHSVDEWH